MKIKLTNQINICSYGWFIVYIVLSSVALFGKSSLIQVEASVDKSVINIGDRVRYSLKIHRSENIEIQSPGKAANLGIFEIKDYHFHEPLQKDGRVVEQFDYVIAVFDTGRFVIPPFPIAFLASDTSKKYQLINSEPLEIYVESLLKTGDTKIRDVRSPLTIPQSYSTLLWSLLGVLLLVAALGIAYWQYKKRLARTPVSGKEMIRPAHEIALEELQKLLESNALQQGKCKLFYSTLSNIFRQYMEGEYSLKALEETTSEILLSLKELEPASENIQLAEKVLKQCDLVKFAKYIPSPEESGNTIESMKQFIEKNRLKHEAVEKIGNVEEKEAEAEKVGQPSEINQD